MSKLYPHVISTKASSHIYTSQWPVIDVQKAQLSQRDRAMRRVSSNLANCNATVEKLLVRQVLNKSNL